LDTDGDGLLDVWELFYFGNLSQTAADDFDLDGFTNLQEKEGGTDPTDENDYPGKSEPEPEEDFVSSLWWIFVIIVLVIIVLMETILLLKKQQPVIEEMKENEKNESDDIDSVSQEPVISDEDNKNDLTGEESDIDDVEKINEENNI
jgi:hypothetical protein